MEEEKIIKKDKRRVRTIIFFLLLLLMMVTIGYSIVATNLSINGITSIKRSEWIIHFDNIRILTGEDLTVEPPSFTNNSTIVDFSIKLDRANDLYEFLVDVYNEGTIDAKLSNYIKTGLSDEQLEYVDYGLSYSDGSELNEGDVVLAGERKTIKVKVKYLKLLPIDEEDMNNKREEVNLSFKVDYVQR